PEHKSTWATQRPCGATVSTKIPQSYTQTSALLISAKASKIARKPDGGRYPSSSTKKTHRMKESPVQNSSFLPVPKMPFLDAIQSMFPERLSGQPMMRDRS